MVLLTVMLDKTSTSSIIIPCGLFVVKPIDFDVAMVDIDIYSGKIQYILDVYLPEELQIGCKLFGKNIVGRT